MDDAGAGLGELGQMVAYVCRRRDYLRQLLTGGQDAMQDPPVLRGVVEAVTGAQPPDDTLRESLHALDQAVRREGDELGIAAATQAAAAGRGLPLPGTDASAPFAPAYPCPIGRCAGRHPDQTTVFPLMCSLTGREIRQVRR